MSPRLTFNCLLAASLGYAGTIGAVVWDRKDAVIAPEYDEERPPEQTPAAGPGELDLPETFIVKAPPAPRAPLLPKPQPKPQPTPRPKAPPPGGTATPTPKPTPTPPITRPT